MSKLDLCIVMDGGYCLQDLVWKRMQGACSTWNIRLEAASGLC